MAKALAGALGTELIRLQCYEGIDAAHALYEWDYTRQLLQIRALDELDASGEQAIDDLFSARFLVERPLLRALRAGGRAVLLVDEVDRADDEFEAFLLEVLSDFQVTVPELGTISAEEPPVVVLTSNRTRELHDALKRRCLYHWIDYPDPRRELDIVRVRAPEVPEALAGKVAAAVTRLRGFDLVKRPGVAETIDWARAVRGRIRPACSSASPARCEQRASGSPLARRSPTAGPSRGSTPLTRQTSTGPDPRPRPLRRPGRRRQPARNAATRKETGSSGVAMVERRVGRT